MRTFNSKVGYKKVWSVYICTTLLQVCAVFLFLLIWFSLLELLLLIRGVLKGGELGRAKNDQEAFQGTFRVLFLCLVCIREERKGDKEEVLSCLRQELWYSTCKGLLMGYLKAFIIDF